MLLILLTALWAVVFVGFMQLIALKTRSAAATNSGGLVFFPLLFLTPNFVPRDLLTRSDGDRGVVEPRDLRDGVAALADPRSTSTGRTIWPGFLVVAAAGALMLYLNVRLINNYD